MKIKGGAKSPVVIAYTTVWNARDLRPPKIDSNTLFVISWALSITQFPHIK
jgi:hypothetical protein